MASSASAATEFTDTLTDTILGEPVFGRRNLVVAVALFAGALLSLFVMQQFFHINSFGVSHVPDYLYQASSFLHGHLALDINPDTTDVIVAHGKHYVVYPPFPAVALMPFVAIWSMHTSDILFTAVVSAFDLPLLYLLFEQARAAGVTRRPWLHNLTLAVLLYFGSIHLWLSLGGWMWFTGHIVCCVFTVLSLLLAFRRHYGWSAVALGCAFFSRGTVALGYPFLLYLAWQDVNREHLVERLFAGLRARRIDWEAIPWRRLAPPLAVSAATVVVYLVRNTLFFGSPLESGYNLLLQQHYPQVTHGLFNVAYVPANIIANFFSFPLVTFTNAFDRHPVLDMMNGGYCIGAFVTTPMFLLLFWRNSRRNLLRIVLGSTLAIFVVAVLCFHAAGYFQFGARYLFDAYPYAFLLLAISDMRFDWRMLALGAIGVIVNLLGAYQFWTGLVPHL